MRQPTNMTPTARPEAKTANPARGKFTGPRPLTPQEIESLRQDLKQSAAFYRERFRWQTAAAKATGAKVEL